MEEVFFDFYSFASLRFMHTECFELWQDNILAFVSKLKDGGKRGKQQWTEKQKVSGVPFPQGDIVCEQASLWRQPNYHLAVEVCGCCCGEVSSPCFYLTSS